MAAGKSAPITVYGPDETPFSARAVRPEAPGAFSFPPVASLITAGGRLVLALIERMVGDAGGSHAFCDTDSMAIVATERGGLVLCPGGRHRLPNGRPAIRALAWAEVDGIVAEFASLNPYDPEAVQGSILEVEPVNFDPESGARRQLWCLSVAAKRYTLYTRDSSGEPHIVPQGYKRHGLGFLVGPTDGMENDATSGPSQDRWEAALWEGLVRERLGLDRQPPPWLDRPAASRLTISSPWHLQAFDRVNAGKRYADQIKPFNFMLEAHQYQIVRSDDSQDVPMRLVSPYESNPKRWTLRNWFDVHSGEKHRITTEFLGTGDATRVRDLGTVASTYPYHPEPKRCGSDGQPCTKQTEGVLSRRTVHVGGLVCIGKEAHRLEERELVSHLDEVQSVYFDPHREPWAAFVVPRLRVLAGQSEGRKAILAASGLKPRALRDALAGRSCPRAGARSALAVLVQELHMHEDRCCQGCGKPFNTVDPRQRYCTTRCRNREKKWRQQAPQN